MSIVSSSDVVTYLGVASYTADVQALHLGIEKLIKTQCGYEFEAISYFERYDGLGGYYRLELKNFPIISVSRLSTTNQAVIKIKNVNTDATTASVVINTTNVILTVNGGAGNSTSTLAVATYDTLTKLVTAINALDSSYGWQAELYDNAYSAKKTALLFPQQIDVTAWTADQGWDYLYMGEPVDFIIVDRKYIEAYFPYGSQNIAVSYTAGESKDDIKMAILELLKYAYNKKLANQEGIKRFTVGDITTEYFNGINEMPFINDIIQNNIRMVV